MKWNNKGHEFDKIWENISKNDRSFVIWGAGTFGISFYDDFSDKIDVVGWVDSNPQKQGRIIKGLVVSSPEALLESNNSIVLVSTGWTKDVFSQLDRWGYIKNQTYFHIDEFMTIYSLYKENKLFVSNLNINITEFCTLRCQKCSALNPYIIDKKNYSINEISNMLELYFNVVDGVSILGLIGGDAMTHPRFNEVLDFIAKKYWGTKVKHIEIYSNAIIPLKEDSLELFKKYDVIYRYTDYGDCTHGIQKCEKTDSILEKNGIKYDRAKFVQWCDCGYPQETNGISENELRSFYSACDRRSCQGILGTRLFYCGMAIGAERTGYCKADSRDYFELNTDNINKFELMEYMLGYNERGYIEYCKKCNGGPNINTKYITPGEQI